MISVTISPATATTDIFTGVTFIATAVALNGAAAVTSYTWSFGDGSPTVTTRDPTNSVSHTFNSTTLGTKTVSVTATNEIQVGSTTATVSVTAPDLLVSITPSTSSPHIGDHVIFTASVSSTGTVPALNFEWDENGDGTYELVVAAVSGGHNAQDFTFGAIGAHTVKVRVTDPITGRRATATREVTVW